MTQGIRYLWRRCVGDLYIRVHQNVPVSLKLSLSLILSLTLAFFLCRFLSPAVFELLGDSHSHPLVKRAVFEVFYSSSLSMRKKAGIYTYIYIKASADANRNLYE